MARILVADSDAKARGAASVMIRALGHEVEEARSGEDALEKLSLKPCDLVISEIEFPGSDGFELLQQVKTLSPEMPFLFLSAYSTIEKGVRAGQLGADGFMAKPVRRRELSARIAAALSGSESEGGAPLPPLPATGAAMMLGSSLESVLRLAVGALKASEAAVYLSVPGGGMLCRAASGKLAEKGLAALNLKQGDALLKAAEAGAPRRSDRELLCPIGRRAAGLLLLRRSADGQPFIAHDLEVAVKMAADASVAVENSRAYAALSDEKRKLDAVFSHAREGLMMSDDEGRLILVNPSARRLLGHDGPIPEILDKALRGFECWPPLEAIVFSKERDLEFEFRRREPKPLILEGVRTALESGSADSPGGQLFIFRDVTEKRREERMARDILSMISHKLRTPLAVMLGYQDILMEEAEKLGAPQKTALAAIKKQMQKFRYYVDNFLMFMAIRDAKSLKIHREKCVPAALLEEAIGELAVLAQEHNVRIEYDLKSLGELGPIKADSRHLPAALRNLIENGIKFNDRPDGDRRLRVEAAELHSGMLRFSVTDNGPGIAPEDRIKIFEGFYQIDDDFTGQIEGLGLGLAYVKLVAEAHGGRARLESKPGEGSTFMIEIPLGK